ncbi:uncharacterized protein si:dkey-79d12.4 [Electrophorus electricus]|uniref:uncharacterized protein si:dkey-79d12.4 n=1 Tax=Electrophorus electricus TaxID=8005 RepID=UPI0015D00C5B|nr:uncharacterized protein si:dkey-79d12.4 [Electrophorus electricus]XP_035386334.1 uncharacterized protein si:dkey-79d12.4 [Electrophorus electricus]
MEIACEEVMHVVGAELELQQDGDISQHHEGPGTWIVPKHYNLQEDSSEDEDGVPMQVLREGLGDCVCCVCGERFAFLAHLIEHFGVHRSDVRCHLCQVMFPRVISLALHLENSHSGCRLFCDGCGLTFRSAWHMNEHMEQHARRKEVPGPRTLRPSSSYQNSREVEMVEESVVENEEMNVKYLKDEEQEVEVTKVNGSIENHILDIPENRLVLRACELDHNYYCTRSLPKPMVVPVNAHNMLGSVVETSDKVTNTSSETLYVNNNKSHTRTSSKDSEPEGGQQETVKVVVLRNLPQKAGRTSASILEAAYNKVMKSQSRRVDAVEGKAAVCGSASAVPQSAPVELNIKVEDDYEDGGWDCGPIQEEVVKEEDEDSVPSSDQDDGDSLPPGDSAYTPEEDLNSDTDSTTSINYNSDTSADGLQRSRSKGRRLRARSGRQKRARSSVVQKPLAAALEPGSSVDGSICVSCGLRRDPGAVGRCGCAPLHACCLCGLAQGTEEQLLKHQAEKHPSTKYVCASCLCVFPDQNIFTKHACCSKPETPAGPPLAQDKNAGSSKNLPLMILNFVPSPSTGGPSKPPLSTGDSQCRALPALLLTNNVIVNPLQKLGALTNSSLPVLPSKPSSPSNQSVPVQVMATMSLNSEQKVTGLVLKGAQGPGMSVSTVSQAETGQLNVVMHPQTKAERAAPSAADVKPAKMVIQGVVMSQHQLGSAGQPACVPVRMPSLMASLLGPSAASSPAQPQQSRVALRIPTYPCTSTKVSVSFSPTPVQFPAPTIASANGPKTLPPRNQLSAGRVRPMTLRLPAPGLIPGPVPGPTLGPAPLPGPALGPVPAGALGPTSAPSPAPIPLSSIASTPAQFPTCLQSPAGCSPTPRSQPPSQGPLKIVAMFVNQSQELALQKRLRQSWSSKAVFPCRQCGAISRQPSLGVRHRYKHRGPRRHRCQCGRAFQRRLHLLRHQVQHAEAVRYVCAACGRTFQGTHRLGRHRSDAIAKAGPGQPRTEKECRNLFHCVCGQAFARPAALLWHMLKNSKSRKKRLKKFLI